MTSYQSFAHETRLTMKCEWADTNPHMSDMPAGSTHWRCTLRRGRKSMILYFSQGPALRGMPTIVDVLTCLALDASGYDDARSFEEWCSEYGYDADSRKAERTFKLIGQQVDALRRLLDDEFDTLLTVRED